MRSMGYEHLVPCWRLPFEEKQHSETKMKRMPSLYILLLVRSLGRLGRDTIGG